MDVEKLLKENELKVTPQRKAILKVLEKSETLLNAQQLFQEVIKLVPGTNFSTIYRNLDLLLSRGILCRVASESGGVLYELRRQENHHHHVICKGCGASIPIDFCPMKAMEKELSDWGFVPTEHRFDIYGYCNKCYRKHSK